MSTSIATTLFSTDYRHYGSTYGTSGGSVAFEYTDKPTDVPILVLDAAVGAGGIVYQDYYDTQHGGLTEADYLNSALLVAGVGTMAIGGPGALVGVWALAGALYDLGW